MNRGRALVGVLVLATLAIGGCSLEPHYRTDVLVYDNDLAGVWVFESDEQDDRSQPPLKVDIEPRRLPIEDGRVRPDKGEGDSTMPANCYKVRFVEPDTHLTREFGLFALRIGDERVLAFQRTGNAMMSIGDHPLQQVLRYTREGDELRLYSPKYRVVWMPDAQPLAEPAARAAIPTIEQFEARAAGGMFVVFDIDQLVEVLRVHAADPRFWCSDAVRASREGRSRGAGRQSGHGMGSR